MSTLRFYAKRMVVGLVNLLAGPAEWPPQQNMRRRLLRSIGIRLGDHCQISEAFYVYNGRQLSMGHHCRIGAFTKVWDFCPIKIGNNLLASHNLVLISATHQTNKERSNREGPIQIGDNVWIGVNVTIVGPATIGDNVVIGANSLVLGDIPSDTVAAGIPARILQ